MCWWYRASGISSILYIFCWLSWEVSRFLWFMDCWTNSLDRALLATIWDKAFALALSVSFQNHNLTKLEQSVTVDFNFKIIVHICLIMFQSLRMQSTSLQRRLPVPPLITFSRQLPLSQHWYVKFLDIFIQALCFILRMINLAAISTSHICSLLIFCMSLSWVSGKHFSPI